MATKINYNSQWEFFFFNNYRQSVYPNEILIFEFTKVIWTNGLAYILSFVKLTITISVV